jgi:integrase
MKIFFKFINLLPNGNLEEQCNLFAVKGLEDHKWAFNNIVKFLQYQKERVEKEEITGATIRNFVKTIKLFCEMTDIPIQWKKITRGLPKSRKFADDRAPTIEEIQNICEYPDRRIKAIVYTMASSGIRLGAWDYLQLKHITPIEREGKIVAAKIIVYAGDHEEYFSFITSEAYHELEKWIQYRANCGENINENSWVMRQLWDTKRGYYHHGTIKNPEKLKSSGIKRLIEDALWTQGIRKKSNLKNKRYEFQTDHGMRKLFKTRCEMSGMKSINIEILMGHSIGISDSYYKITEEELLNQYLKAIDFLIINSKNQLQKKVDEINIQNQKDTQMLQDKLFKKEEEIGVLHIQDQNNIDAIAALADKIQELMLEIELIKKKSQFNQSF